MTYGSKLLRPLTRAEAVASARRIAQAGLMQRKADRARRTACLSQQSEDRGENT